VWFTGVRVLDDLATRRSWWLTPFRDAVNFLIWIAGFVTNRIEWRGVSYRVKKGLLEPVGGGTGKR
jgi:hypothetical protein